LNLINSEALIQDFDRIIRILLYNGHIERSWPWCHSSWYYIFLYRQWLHLY